LDVGIGKPTYRRSPPASGHYRHPLRVVAFNTAEGWMRDITADIAGQRCG